MVEIGVRLRKVVIFTVKGCYRSISNHPFLVGMLCVLILLYRSFPFVFSVLVSASPVLVCTAILLGTLLSFGQPNIPEIEKEERVTHEIVSLKTGFLGDAVVVESDESCSVDRYSDQGRDVIEKSTEERGLVVDGISNVDFDGSGERIEESSREIQYDDRVREETQRELQGFEHELKNELEVTLGDRKSQENQYSLVNEVDDENLELENDRSPVGSVDSKVVNVDSLDSPPGSPWKHVGEGEDEEEEEDRDDEALDSGSDRAESSSPDASMADIIPMLDELHPLLDEDAPQAGTPLSHAGSDAASQSSAISNESSIESDDDSENQEEFEVGDDDNEDGEDEEEIHGDKEDETKSAITWTEEDQRNLMELGSLELERNQRLENLIAKRRAEGITWADDNEDGEDEEETQGDKEDQTKSAITWTEEDQRNLMELGSSELERNQRLENLIARRRARKTTSTVTEKNLIDLESADPPFKLPAITTTRTNPFDLPNDSFEHMGLPPIPGSAPSILLPWRNPFDLPYDSSEEKPDLMEDSFQQEFTPHQSKDPFFRRHESFSVRPSTFGINRAEKQDIRLRPYFVPERIASEGTSYFPFHGQSSEVSDSKISSAPDTESGGSDADSVEQNTTEEGISVAEVMNQTEEDIAQEPELISMIEEVKNQEDISQEPEIISMVEEVRDHTEEDISREPELISMIEEVRNDPEEDIPREPELISMIENAPEHIGHGSESSEEEDSLDSGDAEKRHDEADEIEVNLNDTEHHHETEISLAKEPSGGDQLEVNSTEILLNDEAVEQRYGGVTSSSSLSEESEMIHAKKEAELPSFVEGRDCIGEPRMSTQPSAQPLHLDIPTALTDDTQHKEPVYDSSPSSVRKNLSSSSISSDQHVEYETGLPPVVVKRTVSFAERESEVKSRDIDNDTPVDKEMLDSSSQIHPVDKSELEITESDVIPVNREMLAASSQTHSVDENEMESMGEVEISEDGIVKYDSSAVDEISDNATESVVLGTVLHHTSVDASSSTDTSRTENLMHEDVSSQVARSFDSETHVTIPDIDTMQSVSMHSDEQKLVASEREKHSENVEPVLSVQLDTLSPTSQLTTDHITQGEAVLSEQGTVESNSGSVHDEENEMLSSSNDQLPLTEKSVSISDEKLALSDKSADQPPSNDHKEVLEPSVIVDSVEEASNTHNSDTTEVRELVYELSLDKDIPTSLESTTVPSEEYEIQAPADEEVNVIDEIDEELLLELDTVGDFRVKEIRELDDHVEFGGPISSVQPYAKTLTGLVQRISSQSHRAKYVTPTENIDAPIKETNKSDEDMKLVSELETSGTSAAEQIDTRQHDQREVDTNDLEPTSETPKEKEADFAANILEHKTDSSKTNSTMPDSEVRVVKDIESTSEEIEVFLPNHEPSSEEPPPRGSEEGEAGEASSQSKIKMETPNIEEKLFNDFDLDLNQLPEENAEQIPVSDSVINAVVSKDKEGTPQELGVLDRASSDEIDLAMKKASGSSQEDVLEVSENGSGSAKDVANQVDVKSDVKETTQYAPEKPDSEVKILESQDVVAPLDVSSKNESSSKTSSS